MGRPSSCNPCCASTSSSSTISSTDFCGACIGDVASFYFDVYFRDVANDTCSTCGDLNDVPFRVMARSRSSGAGLECRWENQNPLPTECGGNVAITVRARSDGAGPTPYYWQVTVSGFQNVTFTGTQQAGKLDCLNGTTGIPFVSTLGNDCDFSSATVDILPVKS